MAGIQTMGKGAGAQIKAGGDPGECVQIMANSVVSDKVSGMLVDQVNLANRKVGGFPAGEKKTDGSKKVAGDEKVFGASEVTPYLAQKKPSAVLFRVGPTTEVLGKGGDHGGSALGRGELAVYDLNAEGDGFVETKVQNVLDAGACKKLTADEMVFLGNTAEGNAAMADGTGDLLFQLANLEDGRAQGNVGANESLMRKAFSFHGVGKNIKEGAESRAHERIAETVRGARALDVLAERSCQLSICNSLLLICEDALKEGSGGDPMPLENRGELHEMLISSGMDADLLARLIIPGTPGTPGTLPCLLPPDRMIVAISEHFTQDLSPKPGAAYPLGVPHGDFTDEKGLLMRGLCTPSTEEARDVQGLDQVGKYRFFRDYSGLNARRNLLGKLPGLEDERLPFEDINPDSMGIAAGQLWDIAEAGKLPDDPLAIYTALVGLSDGLHAHAGCQLSGEALPVWQGVAGDLTVEGLANAARIVQGQWMEANLQVTRKTIMAVDSALKETDAKCRIRMVDSLQRYVESLAADGDTDADGSDIAVMMRADAQAPEGANNAQERASVITFVGNNLSEALLQAREIHEADYKYAMVRISQVLVADPRYAETLGGQGVVESDHFGKCLQKQLGSLDPQGYGGARGSEIESCQVFRKLRNLSPSDKRGFGAKELWKSFGTTLKKFFGSFGTVAATVAFIACGVVLGLAVCSILAAGIGAGAIVIAAAFIVIAALGMAVCGTWMVLNLFPFNPFLLAYGAAYAHNYGELKPGDSRSMKFLEKVMDGDKKGLRLYAETRSIQNRDLPDAYEKTAHLSDRNTKIALIQARAAREYMSQLGVEGQKEMFKKAEKKLAALGRKQEAHRSYYHRKWKPRRKGDEAVYSSLREAGQVDNSGRTGGYGIPAESMVDPVAGVGAVPVDLPLSGMKEMIILAAYNMALSPEEHENSEAAEKDLRGALQRVRSLYNRMPAPRGAGGGDNMNMGGARFRSFPAQAEAAWLVNREVSDAVRGIRGELNRELDAAMGAARPGVDEYVGEDVTGATDVPNPVLAKLKHQGKD